MSDEMYQYYKLYDHHDGWTCKLTQITCADDCRRCVFAKVAFEDEMKMKKKMKKGNEE
jgi:hypothetical protein